MTLDVGIPGAFLAGLLSFLSPCVLPLVPGYLAFIGGTSVEAETPRPLLPAVAFVLGFVLVFVAFGATASAVSRLLVQHGDMLGKIAGALIIAFGLHVAGLVRIPFLYYEARVHAERRPAGLAGAFVLGLAFAFGWTPCVGPVLASILLVAGAGATLSSGVALLGAYGAGMGLPFLLAAAAARPFAAFLLRFRRYVRAVELAMGGLLVATGALIFAGSMPEVGQWLLETIPALGRIG